MKFAAIKTSGWIVQVLSEGKFRTLVCDDGFEYEVANSELRDVLPTDKDGWSCE